MNTILQAYTAYCKGAEFPAPAARAAMSHRWLASAILFDFPDTLAEYLDTVQKMLQIHDATTDYTNPDDWERLRTSGTSTGVARTYFCGPHAQRWIGDIWNHLSSPFGRRPTIRILMSKNPDHQLEAWRNEEGLYQYDARCGLMSKQRVNDLLFMLRDVMKRYPKLTLYCQPDIYLYLNQSPVFKEFAIANKNKINYLSGYWEPFYKKRELISAGVWFGNVMIDWPSGVNFWTCSAGERHSLPITANSDRGPINLLNLAPDPISTLSEKDAFKPLDVKRCACGYNRLVFSHLPHPTSAIRQLDGTPIFRPGLAEELKGHYQHMQFRQYGNTLMVSYKTEDGTFPDKKMLGEFWSNLGFNVVYDVSKVECVFGKRPTFMQPLATEPISLGSNPNISLLSDQQETEPAGPLESAATGVDTHPAR